MQNQVRFPNRQWTRQKTDCLFVCVQRGLEGSLDLRPLSRPSLWDVQTRPHPCKVKLRSRSQAESTPGWFLFLLMVERAERLVSLLCFFLCESLVATQRLFLFLCHPFSVATTPKANFSICKSNLLSVLWFCRQCSSILFPAPPAHPSPPHFISASASTCLLHDVCTYLCLSCHLTQPYAVIIMKRYRMTTNRFIFMSVKNSVHPSHGILQRVDLIHFHLRSFLT